jgi:hypothetical protein
MLFSCVCKKNIMIIFTISLSSFPLPLVAPKTIPFYNHFILLLGLDSDILIFGFLSLAYFV